MLSDCSFSLDPNNHEKSDEIEPIMDLIAEKILGVLNKLCQTAFSVQLNFQSAGKEDIKLRHS
ncbi:MAG: hypothetical protein O7157_03595 [Wolbachia endosymbiont of Tetragnatha montana]|nr:hypothetical protein [Wolbachia endosymbiont of Tetragnatha montana]